MTIVNMVGGSGSPESETSNAIISKVFYYVYTGKTYSGTSTGTYYTVETNPGVSIGSKYIPDICVKASSTRQYATLNPVSGYLSREISLDIWNTAATEGLNTISTTHSDASVISTLKSLGFANGDTATITIDAYAQTSHAPYGTFNESIKIGTGKLTINNDEEFTISDLVTNKRGNLDPKIYIGFDSTSSGSYLRLLMYISSISINEVR